MCIRDSFASPPLRPCLFPPLTRSQPLTSLPSSHTPSAFSLTSSAQALQATRRKEAGEGDETGEGRKVRGTVEGGKKRARARGRARGLAKVEFHWKLRSQLEEEQGKKKGFKREGARKINRLGERERWGQETE
eukprot:890324-Rhodomonas_salina.1